ncbi:MAG: O-antigen polymerase [Polaribacter sp.]|uniref:O-antigen polymerase n=1 Tax=Polaribacter sp. TaxID=1920175 RepID=UPI002F35E19D
MKKKIYFIINLTLLTVLFVLFTLYPTGINEGVIWFCLLIFYIYFIKSVSKPISILPHIKTFMKIDLFFMMFYYIIFFYPYQLHVLNIQDLSYSDFLYKAYAQYTNPAILSATIGLVSFQIGFHKVFKFKKVSISIVYPKKYFKKLNRIVAVFTVFILALYAKTGMVAMFASSYAGSKTGDVTYDAIFNLVTYFIILSVIAVLFYFINFRKLNLISIILLSISVIWCLALLVIGDRNTFFIIAIVIGSGYFTFIRGITRKKIILFLFPVLFLYQVVEVSRVSEERNLEAIWLAMTETNVEEEGLDIGSFGITTVGLRATFKIIEKNQGFFLGKFKFVSLTSIVPYSSRFFLDKNDPYTGSSNVLKEDMIGSNASWGTGTNIISDAYLDFGIIGVVVIMYLFGYFGGFVKYKLINEPNNAQWIFIYLILIGYYSELSRYGFDFPLRSIVWTFLLFWFISNKNYIKKNLNTKIF